MDGIGHIFNIAIVQTRQRDAPIPRQEDAVLARQLVAHVLAHAREGEHPNLSGNVGPVMRAPGRLELVHQQRSHRLDAAGHGLAFAVVLVGQAGIVQHGLDDVGAVNRRAAVHRPDDQLELAHHGLPLFGAVGHDAEGAGPLSVQTKVLGKGLGQGHVVPLLHEQPQRRRIGLGIPRGKSLVGRIEEHMMTLGPDIFGDGLPLLHRWVTSRWIVRAGVKENDAAVRGIAEVLQHAVVIQAVGLGVVVAVPADV